MGFMLYLDRIKAFYNLNRVRCIYDSEASVFENSLNKPHWINSLPANSFLPMVFIVQTTGYEKFLLYCIETGEYNPEFAQVNYNYISIGYSKKNKGLIIYEFTIK